MLKIVATLLLIASAAAAKAPPIEDQWLPKLLAAHPQRFGTVLADPARYRFQILLSEVRPGPDGAPTLLRHGYRLGAEYFYPASAPKTIAAVAALAKARSIAKRHRWFNVDTPLAFHPLFEGETLDERDPSNLKGEHITLRQLIRRMSIVSSNYAFNRLYDFVGHRALNEFAWDAGLDETLFVHRMSWLKPPKDQRRMPAMEWRGPRTIHIPARTSDLVRYNDPGLPGITAGVAERLEGARVEGPKSFVQKNRMSLRDLQDLLIFIMRPELNVGRPGVAINPTDRKLLQEAMLQTPGQSENPVLPETRYNPNRFKPIRPGLLRVGPAARWKIWSKAGKAYGFRTENAYIVDTKTQRAYFLAATLYVNENGVLNDGKYQYDTLADPVLWDLAEVIAQALQRGSLPAQ
jgi:hypothetical protein